METLDINYQIHYLRKRNGFTLREYSEMTGINKSNLSRIENGEISPTLDTVERLLKPLGYCLYIQRLDEE